MDNTAQQYKIFSWNVRGMNNPARQEESKQLISLPKQDLIYLQETKMPLITTATVRKSLG
jgi:exonuclease III